jgi:Pyridoxal phosphate biosynthesis protein
LVGSKKLLEKQILKLGYKFRLDSINLNEINKIKVNHKGIYIININFKFKKIFDKISNKSSDYLTESFKTSMKLLKKNKTYGLINGPISKKHFLKKKYLGITEYLSKKTNLKKNTTMLIYNSKISVSPITTHLPIKLVSKFLDKKKIINNVLEINKFYLKFLKKRPRFAVLGLNPHCETISDYSEEDKIIKPAIKIIKKKKINISGPYSADTFFSIKNISKFDVVIGMYHDQVLTPMKTIFNFDAINITLGLPFIRISPDHGPNNQMLGKKISNPKSLIFAINFFKKIDAN